MKCRAERRCRNGELLVVAGDTVFPHRTVHLIARRGREIFDEEVRIVEPVPPSSARGIYRGLVYGRRSDDGENTDHQPDPPGS